MVAVVCFVFNNVLVVVWLYVFFFLVVMGWSAACNCCITWPNSFASLDLLHRSSC